MIVSQALKSGYVTVAHGAGRIGEAVGLIGWLDRRSDKSRTAHWLRSLSAIHDVETLVALDVPWWTYQAIDRIEAFLEERPKARAFEFGSGASTVWLARRASEVVSVEHVPDWHARVGRLLDDIGIGPRVDLNLVKPDRAPSTDPLYLSQKPGEEGDSFERYAKAILEEAAPFDLIVIDGRARQACLKHAIQRLAPDGMIVFDNSNRPRYQDALARSRMQVERYRGLTPALPYPDETTLLSVPPRRR
ncbi:class I SAM-dependent methyltransferase [Tropicimonas marinistellae]|uniref:class I SAM-dependent methyltransferase n=1 Tax=Tropicimonas marinistellae TaxID=1739787 RepID=UPI00098FE696|nr:class I SAM-dependent methyltransferase [Tropicimonas marinistellae]